MKNINELRSTNPLAAYVMEAPSFRSSIMRYRILTNLAKRFSYGDTFIADDVKGIVSPTYLGTMLTDMKEYYKINCINIKLRRGSKIIATNGQVLGVTSCNVYEIAWDTNKMKKDLSEINDLVMEMFKM